MQEYLDEQGTFGFGHLYPSKQAYVQVIANRGFIPIGITAVVNNIIQCACYSVIQRGHFFLDLSKAAIAWSDIFDTPIASVYHKLDYADRSFLNKKLDKPLWRTMLDSTHRASRDGLVYDLPEIGFKGELEQLAAGMANAVFKPIEPVRRAAAQALGELGLDDEPYAAFHVRRGDKVNGFFRPNGEFCLEGELVPLDAYVSRLRTMAPAISKVFLMTDDYSAYEEATANFPELNFVTLCLPSTRGYVQAEQNVASAETRLQNLHNVLCDIAIARGAETFVGAYRSNVSRFIHSLRGPNYDRSASADSIQRWMFT